MAPTFNQRAWLKNCSGWWSKTRRSPTMPVPWLQKCKHVMLEKKQTGLPGNVQNKNLLYLRVTIHQYSVYFLHVLQMARPCNAAARTERYLSLDSARTVCPRLNCRSAAGGHYNVHYSRLRVCGAPPTAHLPTLRVTLNPIYIRFGWWGCVSVYRKRVHASRS